MRIHFFKRLHYFKQKWLSLTSKLRGESPTVAVIPLEALNLAAFEESAGELPSAKATLTATHWALDSEEETSFPQMTTVEIEWFTAADKKEVTPSSPMPLTKALKEPKEDLSFTHFPSQRLH